MSVEVLYTSPRNTEMSRVIGYTTSIPTTSTLSSCSLIKSNRHLGVVLKKRQANYIRDSFIPTEELSKELDEVNFLKNKDIKIDKDNNCSSLTPVPLVKKALFLLVLYLKTTLLLITRGCLYYKCNASQKNNRE